MKAISPLGPSLVKLHRPEGGPRTNAAAEALGVDGDELGDLLFTLSELSEGQLEFFPIGADNKAIVALRSLREDPNATIALLPAAIGKNLSCSSDSFDSVKRRSPSSSPSTPSASAAALKAATSFLLTISAHAVAQQGLKDGYTLYAEAGFTCYRSCGKRCCHAETDSQS